MARPPREPAFPSPLAPAIARLVHDRGGDVALVLGRCGLDPDVLALDESRATVDEIEALLDAAAGELGDPFLALRLPEELPFRRYPLADLAARASGTVREALSHLARHAATLHPRLDLVFDEDRGEGRWRLRMPGRPRGFGRHVHEYSLALALACARRESPGAVSASRAWFAHARPRDLTPLVRFFGTRDLSFGREDSGLALPAAALDTKVRAGDPRLLATVDAFAARDRIAPPRPPRFTALVTERIRAELPASADVTSVARSMRLSPRTLQRRLEAEGATFSEVLDGVRERLARSWVIEPSTSLAEVTERLGFSDVATFGRAFKRWTGMPPGAYRRRQSGVRRDGGRAPW